MPSVPQAGEYAKEPIDIFRPGKQSAAASQGRQRRRPLRLAHFLFEDRNHILGFRISPRTDERLDQTSRAMGKHGRIGPALLALRLAHLRVGTRLRNPVHRGQAQEDPSPGIARSRREPAPKRLSESQGLHRHDDGSRRPGPARRRESERTQSKTQISGAPHFARQRNGLFKRSTRRGPLTSVEIDVG